MFDYLATIQSHLDTLLHLTLNYQGANPEATAASLTWTFRRKSVLETLCRVHEAEKTLDPKNLATQLRNSSTRLGQNWPAMASMPGRKIRGRSVHSLSRPMIWGACTGLSRRPAVSRPRHSTP